MKQEFEIPTCSPVSIPYKWESAPGRPIVEAMPEVESWTSSLRPPPGIRRVTAPSVSRFDGFEPEPRVLDETQLAGKILKKLNRLRRKSMVAGACFTPKASRVMQQSSRLVAMKELAMSNVGSDTMSRSCSVTSTFDQPSTPHYSTSVHSSFYEPFSGATNSSAGAASSSPCSTSAQPSSYCRFEDGKCLEEGNESRDAIKKSLPGGPCDSAWHQPHGDGPPTCVPQKWQMRSSSSNLVPTFLQQSTPSHSFKHLLFVRTFRKSKTSKQLDFGA